MQCLLKTVVSQILVVLIPHIQVLYLLEDCWDQSPISKEMRRNTVFLGVKCTILYAVYSLAPLCFSCDDIRQKRQSLPSSGKYIRA